MVLTMIDWLSPMISCNLIPSSNPSHTLSATIYIYIQTFLRLRIIISNMSKIVHIIPYGRKGGTICACSLRSMRRDAPSPSHSSFNRTSNRLYLPVSSCSYALLIDLYISPLYNLYRLFRYDLSMTL